MKEIRLSPLDRLGFDFVPGKADENRPLPRGTTADDWRPLTENEVLILKDNRNRADDWANLSVLDGFRADQVEDCRFYGPIRIGALSPSFLEYHDFRLPVGLYSCTIVACDIGSDVAMENVSYMAHMSVEDRCILFNVNEMITTNHSKFGNGVVMDGEDEEVRIWLEIANENGGRKVLPFDGMLPADAWLWSKYRDDEILMSRFIEMTGRVRPSELGEFGRIGRESIIKDCRIIKDVRVGEGAYIKGCNKLKNLTINSDTERITQIGEGCELVNGIIGYGCRVFYGVKAVRFILNDHSALKYGARLINSILGSNSTISCCEVLNSLIFGSHEQHHNSSFLCASVLMGQTNMASAATVGSNHNSRSSDGEIVADRGFWPGLSVSLKHNSRFAAFCLIAKGSYPAELDIPLPFCLVSNHESDGELQLMPGYWFRYNMYALARNAAKTSARDKRAVKHQELEFDWLAPDTVEQMLQARRILENWAEESEAVRKGRFTSGKVLLGADKEQHLFAGPSYSIENGRRPVRILHAGRSWKDYGRMIRFWCIRELVGDGSDGRKRLESALSHTIPGGRQSQAKGTSDECTWVNVGGQLIQSEDLEGLKNKVRNGAVLEWRELHEAYRDLSSDYVQKKQAYAAAILPDLTENMSIEQIIEEAKATAVFIQEGVEESRKKDYESPFRNITFNGSDERDAVIGPYDANAFIQEAREKQAELMKLLGSL